MWDFAQPFGWIFGNIDAQEAFEDCDKSTIGRTAHAGRLSSCSFVKMPSRIRKILEKLWHEFTQKIIREKEK